MGPTTLLFLIKKTEGAVSEVCLAMKKRSFGKGRWNGTGGKVLPDETIEQEIKGEALEEVGVLVKDFTKVAELDFKFPHKEEWNQLAHVYFCHDWDKEPVESEEMSPKWFAAHALPFAEMWPDDIFWLPKVLAGSRVRGQFTFAPDESVLEHTLEEVEEF